MNADKHFHASSVWNTEMVGWGMQKMPAVVEKGGTK